MIITFFLTMTCLPVGMAQISLQPTLTISPLNPQSTMANVTETTGDTVNYTATVTVTKPPIIGTVEVDLEGRNSNSYPTIVEPDHVEMTTPGDFEINITVQVPPKASASNTSQVIIEGVLLYPGGTKSAVSSGLLEVSQYYMAEGKVYTQVDSGSPQEFDISVRNMGNGPDSFTIDVVDISRHEGDGFEFQFVKRSTDTLDHFGNESLRLKISYKATTPSGERTFKVRIKSDGGADAGELVYTDVSVTVNVRHIGGGTMGSYGAIIIMIIVLIVIIGGIVGLRKGRSKKKEIGKRKETKKKEQKPPEEKQDATQQPAESENLFTETEGQEQQITESQILKLQKLKEQLKIDDNKAMLMLNTGLKIKLNVYSYNKYLEKLNTDQADQAIMIFEENLGE